MKLKEWEARRFGHSITITGVDVTSGEPVRVTGVSLISKDPEEDGGQTWAHKDGGGPAEEVIELA